MSLVFVLLVFGLAFAIATAQEVVIRVARAHTRTVRQWGGYVLLGVGIWTILLAVFAGFFARIFPV